MGNRTLLATVVGGTRLPKRSPPAPVLNCTLWKTSTSHGTRHDANRKGNKLAQNGI